MSKQEVDAAKSNMKMAEAAVGETKANLELLLKGARTEDREAAKAQYESTKANLDLIDYQITQSKLLAPVNGVIRARLQEVGDMTTSNKSVYTIALIHPKWVRVYASEMDLGHINMGAAAQVIRDSQPNQPITGKIGYISSVAEFTPKTVQTEDIRTTLVYEVRIYVDDPNDQLKMGQPVTVNIAKSSRPTATEQSLRQGSMSMSVESIVIATDLNKTFKAEQKGLDDVQALQGINMQIKAGQLTALVGPDGAGKTTFLRLIAGLYEPTTGSLKVLGMDVAKDPQSVQDRISYMPQKFGLYEDLSIQENLDLYADLHGVPMDVRKERFERLLKITDLARFTERPAGNSLEA